MNTRSLMLLAATLCVALTACTKRVTVSEPVTALPTGGGPQATTQELPPPPPIADPTGDQCLYEIWVVEKGTGNPIGGAFVSLVREVPEPLFMREPKRSSVVSEARTILQGRAYALVATGTEKNDLDGKMKWWLVRGPGFDPFLTEAGVATGGQRHTLTVEMTILPIAKFIVRAPNGDRANNAIVTMKQAAGTSLVEGEGKMGDRPGGSVNYGTTERADDFGTVQFNRPHGTYEITATDENGKHRLYQTVQWTGDWNKPMELQLPEQSMSKN